jgi:hypothetical protein
VDPGRSRERRSRGRRVGPGRELPRRSWGRRCGPGLLTLPPPPPIAPTGRGFFEGDWFRLELLVVDARTGEVRRAKVLTEDVDVRDAVKIGQLIDGALASANGWEEPEAAP